MEIKHLIWHKAPYSGLIRGILELKVSYHGDNSTYKMLIQGEFDIDTQRIRPKIPIAGLYSISPDDMHASGFSVTRYAEIAD